MIGTCACAVAPAASVATAVIVFVPGLSGTCAVHAPLGRTGTGWPPTTSDVIPEPALVMPDKVAVAVDTVVPPAGAAITTDGGSKRSCPASARAGAAAAR